MTNYKVECKVNGPAAVGAKPGVDGANPGVDGAKPGADGPGAELPAAPLRANIADKPDEKKNTNTKPRIINIQVVNNEEMKENLGIEEIKLIENYFEVDDVNTESIGVRGYSTGMEGKYGYKYTAARHGIKVGTKILEINGQKPLPQTDKQTDIKAFMKQAFNGSKSGETHTISLKVENVDESQWNKEKKRWKIIKYFLPKDVGLDFKLGGTTFDSYPYITKVAEGTHAYNAGLRGSIPNAKTEVKYMAFQPMRKVHGIHYALTTSGTVFSQKGAESSSILASSIAGPAEIMISKSTTPWKGSYSNAKNATPAPGSGSIPIDIFINAKVPDETKNIPVMPTIIDMKRDAAIEQREDRVEEKKKKKEKEEEQKNAATQIQRVVRDRQVRKPPAGGGGPGNNWEKNTSLDAVLPGAEDKWKIAKLDDKGVYRWNSDTMFPIIRMNARSSDSVFPFGEPMPTYWRQLINNLNKTIDSPDATQDAISKSKFKNMAVTVKKAMEQMKNFIEAVEYGGVVTLVVTDSNLGAINNKNPSQRAGMRKRRKRNIRSLVRKRATKRKGTRHKGTRNKKTRHKRTRHKKTRNKKTRHKGTRHKGTRHKKTKRKGTRRN